MSASTYRQLPAARLRLGMRVANGLEVIELRRPAPDAVKRGYGRIWVAYDNGDGWQHYPHDWVTLAVDEDAPADPTMDGWHGRWWPLEERQLDVVERQLSLFEGAA